MPRYEKDKKLRAMRDYRNEQARKHTAALRSGSLSDERAAKAEVTRVGRAIEREVRKRDKG